MWQRDATSFSRRPGNSIHLKDVGSDAIHGARPDEHSLGELGDVPIAASWAEIGQSARLSQGILCHQEVMTRSITHVE